MALRTPNIRLTVFWFRRDLRLADNTGLYQALTSGFPVLGLFIFDTDILDKLPRNDPRFTFIHTNVRLLNLFLHVSGSAILPKKGKPLDVFRELVDNYNIEAVYTNEDYEPYARKRDSEVAEFLKTRGIGFHSFKDQVVFAPDEILKTDGKPYTVYTPYAKKWLEKFQQTQLDIKLVENLLQNFVPATPDKIPEIDELGFIENRMPVPDPVLNAQILNRYEAERDFPALQGTSGMSVHFRFGKISVRKIAQQAQQHSPVFLGELIWREFFMQILWHFPHVVEKSFKPAYDRIEWRNNEAEFAAWCEGRTGYPLVDAGMRELLATGSMHNRVRMITASFLVKHLLIDWRWGEAFFAEKLMDFDLAGNNGNWQWAAGCGCDAAPYFRIFNPTAQAQKFDKDLEYIRNRIPEFDTLDYPQPIVNHEFARERVLSAYKKALTES